MNQTIEAFGYVIPVVLYAKAMEFKRMVDNAICSINEADREYVEYLNKQAGFTEKERYESLLVFRKVREW